MKFCLNIFFLLVCIINLHAQNEGLQWSEEFEDRGYYSILGESEDAFFVERKYNTRYNDRDVDLEIMRFNQDLELTHAIELRDIEETSYISIATVNSPEGLAHIYHQTTKGGMHIVSAQLISHKNLMKTEIVDLTRFKIKKNAQQNITQDGNYQYTFPLDILLSRDKSKLAITFDQEKVGRDKANYHQYCIIDLNNKFEILHEGDFYSDDQSNKYAFSDKHLSNSGKLTYAIKKYVRNNATEHINKKPAYDYEIHHMSGDTMEYIYDIKVRKEYIDKLTIGSDSEDNLYLAGYTRKQPFGDITKSFLMSLDPLGYERYTVKDPYTRRDIKQIVGKEDNELDDNFQTLEVIPSDEIVYVIRQYRRRASRTSNFNNAGFNNNQFNQFNNIFYHWEYDEVVIDGVGRETGEILWTAVNRRQQEDDNTYSRYFITGQVELVKNNLVFIYNEREENIQRLRRKDKVKQTDIPGDRTAITLARVNPDGDLQYIVTEEEDYYHLPERGSFIGTNSVYFFNHHKNYKKFVVGKSPISLLNF